jgi:glucose/arabinose dehydrogenase
MRLRLTRKRVAILGAVMPLAAVVALCAALPLAACGGGSDDGERAADAGGGAAATRSSGTPAEPAQAARIRLRRVGSFDAPTYLAAPRGDRRRLFVVERAGRIRIVKDGRRVRRAFLDIAGRVQTSGESGLLSMAFAPDYARSRRFYVYYVDRGGTIEVDQFRASRRNPDRVESGSRRVVIRQAHDNFNHKGGQLQFGPDGLLYMGFGDGGGAGDPERNAQNRGRLLGKILRIAPRAGGGYSIPRGNPFRGRAGLRGEIWSYGLRNPYRFSFDRLRGGLVIGDVGQGDAEEVDYVPRPRGRRAPPGGQNFGWPVFEGRNSFGPGSIANHHGPIHQRLHSQGFCSITGGYIVRDRGLGSGLYGRYVYGDLCDPSLRVVSFRGGRASGDRALGPRVSQLVSFGEDARGRIYAVSLDGPVYRLAL